MLLKMAMIREEVNAKNMKSNMNRTLSKGKSRSASSRLFRISSLLKLRL